MDAMTMINLALFVVMVVTLVVLPGGRTTR